MYSRCYLAGAITSLLDNFYECETWRYDLKNWIEDLNSNWKVFNPVEHLEWKINGAHEELEEGKDSGMTLDLYNLRRSDVVIADLRYLSIGTQMELAIAYEHRIPVIGYIDESINRDMIHPWIKNCCLEICDDLEDAKLYFIDHFINED